MFAICKYLIRNISIDFTNKTIDYYSLLRTFNEASILVKTDSSSNGPSLRLSKRYALLWFYLRHIYFNHCKVIFDIHHHHKIFIIYFIVEFRRRPWSYRINELYPNMLRFLFEKLYKNGSPQLEPILELFRDAQSLGLIAICLGISEKFQIILSWSVSLLKAPRNKTPLQHGMLERLQNLKPILSNTVGKLII